MKASLNKKIHEVYVDPLPYTLKKLPPLHVHNPLSLVYFLYRYFQGSAGQAQASAVVDARGLIKVSNETEMARLWEMGFFGKGSLSRSEPSWYGRTARRLGLDGGELTFEELTELRRQKRMQFKKERAQLERAELSKKRVAEGLSPLEEEQPDESEPELEVRPEDKQLIRGDTIVKLEYLELMPTEAVFLSLGLGVLNLYSPDTKSQELDPSEIIGLLGDKLHEYIAYHYFRSLGWCVRSGVKFGTDFVVYRRGPPFHHAEFAVMVLRAGQDEARDWWWSQGVARVVGGVKKTMVFAYVEGPDPASIVWKGMSLSEIKKTLAKFTVQTVIHARWSPSRTRD